VYKLIFIVIFVEMVKNIGPTTLMADVVTITVHRRAVRVVVVTRRHDIF